MTDEFDPVSHRRNTDPATSAEAAEEISASERRRRIVHGQKRALLGAHWREVQKGGYEGLTARQAADLAGLHWAEATKRHSDLIDEKKLEFWPAADGDPADRDGWLVRTNEASNVRARVCVMTVEGRDWYLAGEG